MNTDVLLKLLKSIVRAGAHGVEASGMEMAG